MRRMKDKIEATVTNADYATSAGSASKATNATNATKATTADKLGTSAGTTTQPVYFKDGKPVVIGYTVAKSVPADAKFTDTNTWRGIQNNLTSNSTDQSLSAAQGKALKTLVDGKSDKGHTHNYAGSGSAGGAANSANALNSRGDVAPQTGRIQNYGDVYSYRTISGDSSKGAPSTYTAAIGFGRGSDGTVEICGEWTGGKGLWSRALRDTQDNWYDWQRIYTENYHPNADYANSAGSVKDAGNNSSNTTFAYSKAGMNYGDYTWLAGWNGYELRAVNKNQYLPTAGGTMNGAITFTGSSNGKIYAGPTDNVNGPGGDLNNIVIDSWNGFSFTTNCPNQTYTGKTAVGIDCREGVVKAARFDGTLTGTAATLGGGGNPYAPMTFNWSGKDGQPTWLWGGEDGTNMYVYNPSNFKVNWAQSAANGVYANGFKSSGGGYIRFCNGLQICWGENNKTTTAAVFDVPFKAANYTLVLGGSEDLNNAWYVASRTTTGFTPKQNGFAGVTNWIAIGKWN